MTEREVLLKFAMQGGDRVARDVKDIGDAADRAAKQVAGLNAAERQAMDESRQRVRAGLDYANANERGYHTRPADRPTFDPRDAAMRRINSEEKARQVQAEYDRLREPVATGRDPHDQTGLFGGAAGRTIRRVIGIQALGGAATGLGSWLQSRANNPEMTSGESMNKFVESVGGGLPIIGGLFDGLKALKESFFGLTQAVADAGRRIDAANLNSEVRGQISDVNWQGASQVRGQADRRDQARNRRAALEGTLGRLTPEMMASFRPDERFGVANAGTGEAAFGAFAAETGVDEAQRNFDTAQRNYDAQRASPGLVAAQMRVAFQQGRADRAQAFAAGYQRQVAEYNADPNMRHGISDMSMRAGQTDAVSKAQAEQIELVSRRRELDKELNLLKERSNQLTDAGVKLAEAELARKQAQLEVDKNRLGIVKEQQTAGRSAAEAIGGAPAGTSSALLQRFRLARDRGIDALTGDDLGALEANPATAEFIRNLKRQRGENDPDFRALRGELAQIAPERGGLPLQADLDREVNRLADAIRKASLEAQIEAARKTETAVTEGLTRFGDAVVKSIENGLKIVEAQFIAKLDAKFLEQQNAMRGGR